MSSPPTIDAVRAATASSRDELVAAVRRRFGSRVDAEELVHSAIVRALERAERLREPGRADAWVGRIVRNAVLDELRRHEPVRAGEVDHFATELDEEGTCDCVLMHVESLRPDEASLLRRVIVDGTPVSALAKELGVTPNAATVRLHRARKALKKRMEEECGTTSVAGCDDCGCETTKPDDRA